MGGVGYVLDSQRRVPEREIQLLVRRLSSMSKEHSRTISRLHTACRVAFVMTAATVWYFTPEDDQLWLRFAVIGALLLLFGACSLTCGLLRIDGGKLVRDGLCQILCAILLPFLGVLDPPVFLLFFFLILAIPYNFIGNALQRALHRRTPA